MKTFTFEAYGKTFTAQAEHALAVMEDANRALLWNNPKSKDGCWDESGRPQKFRWIEGNFFD